MKRPPKDELIRLYCDEKLTQKQIADKFGVNRCTVSQWMKRYHIPTRSKSEMHFYWKNVRKEREKVFRPLLEKLYWEEKLTQPEIAKKLGTTQAMISKWMRKYGVARRSRSEAHTRKIDLSPTPDLAYILGVLKGDGDVVCVSSGRYKTWQIRLRVKEKRFALSFKQAVENLNLHTFWWTERAKNNKVIYCVGAHSKMFVEWFTKLSLHDIEELLNNKKKLITSFIRGFYESEGTLYRGHAKSVKCKMTNTDKNLVDLVTRLLGKLGFDSRTYLIRKGGSRRKPLYEIYILVKEVPRFIELVDPCIKR